MRRAPRKMARMRLLIEIVIFVVLALASYRFGFHAGFDDGRKETLSDAVDAGAGKWVISERGVGFEWITSPTFLP